MNHTSSSSPSAPHPSAHRSSPGYGLPGYGPLALALGLAGLLPIPGIAASVAAIICGRLALRDTATPAGRGPARTGIVLGLIGVAAPLVILFVYCVVLGYPFPIHRYRS